MNSSIFVVLVFGLVALAAASIVPFHDSIYGGDESVLGGLYSHYYPVGSSYSHYYPYWWYKSPLSSMMYGSSYYPYHKGFFGQYGYGSPSYYKSGYWYPYYGTKSMYPYSYMHGYGNDYPYVY